MKEKIIAMDGPSGAGKSSITKAVAKSLGLKHIDSGAVYRSAAWYANELFAGTIIDQKILLEKLKQSSLRYQPTSQVLIELNGQDLTTAIREHAVSAMASKISAFSEVRDWVNHQLRLIVQQSSNVCIMEGRDIGSVIFPNAILKIFLTASPLIRAKRRHQELLQMGKLNQLTEQSILDDIIKRDNADSTRAVAPLLCAKDAIKIDTSELSFEQVLDKIVSLAKNALASV